MSGTWVLDSEALPLYLRADRTMTARLAAARKRDVRVITSAATIVEADPQGAHSARLAWALSRLVVEPVTKDTAKEALARMKDSGRTGGHKYALDAIVAATARTAQPPVTVLTSDLDDLKPLCGKQVEVRQV
ncbi:type II toxin-antitoxin system VapC family toxin [Streptomyces caniscabiei]|uniref:type II toxin-antitoxin system VapC family toxin n=1 Tax=Streptomyces caniscabiei TaxID=2746961 RepID=UPI000A394AAA|nr:PIN domain-containing protein [Streptomyces caniscabiei]